MKIERKKYDEERTILIGLIVDKTILGRVAGKWERDMFRSPWANKVCLWCVRYFKKYGDSPRSKVQSLFESYAAKTNDKQEVEIIEQFLAGLSKQYTRLTKESNSDYVLDVAGGYFNQVKLERLAEQIEGNIANARVKEAEELVTNFRRMEMGAGESIFVLEDREHIQQAFEEQHDPLIKFKDGLGKFFMDRLERDGLIAFQGPEKRGKSWWLLEMAFQGVVQHRKVAFFECGDLSKHQIMRRFMVRVGRRPLRPQTIKYPTKIRIVHRPDMPPKTILRTKPQKYNHGLTWKEAYRECRKLTQNRRLKSALRLSVHYNDTLTVDGIRSTLDEWELDGWTADIICIDYADILNMDYYGLEGRDRINQTWKQLRRLSQERHCLVLTATQADAKSYDVKTQRKTHFSEDKRKHAHVTGMVGLNQNDEEKERNIMRLNWIDLREAWYSERKCCYVAVCPELANMSIRSVF